MKKVVSLLCMLLLLITLLPSLAFAESTDMEYLVGTGMHDITGPSAEIVMMGYADSNQSNRGIHLRQRARSFIVVDQDEDNRIVYVSTDLGMAFQSVKDGVVNQLSDNGLSDEQVTFQTPVIYDGLPIARDFGDLKTDVEATYQKGDTVTASFWSGHPRNDLRTGGSFLEIQYKKDDEWITITYDWDWETKYHWKRRSVIAGTSESIIEWTIPLDTPSGTYRIKHNGAYKSLTGIYQYEGYSSEFIVE